MVSPVMESGDYSKSAAFVCERNLPPPPKLANIRTALRVGISMPTCFYGFDR